MHAGRRFEVAWSGPEITPWPWPVSATADLVACPLPAGMTAGAMATAQEMYRLAYERALAAARPSRYALALAASPN